MVKAPRVFMIAMALTVLALALFPLVGERFYVSLVMRIMIFGMFAMSLDLLIGYTGLVSFGHAAFFGLSGYILAILTPDSGPLSLWFALPVCLAGTALAALVIGWFSVRTSGIYFIMLTLAFAQMLFYFFNDNTDFGGSDGLFIFYRPTVSIGGVTVLDLDDPHTLYYFILAALLGTYFLLRVILRSPFGQVIRGIRANEARTRALGFDTFRYKLVSFVLAGTLAGFAGFLEGVQVGIMSPAHLGWHESGTVLMMVILGGMGTLYGPVLGAFAMVFLQDWFQSVTEYWLLLMGAFVIAVVLLLPNGIAGALQGLGARLTRNAPVQAEEIGGE